MHTEVLNIRKCEVDFTVGINPSYPKHINFWKHLYQGWENQTFQIFDRFLSPDFAYLDIGAWIGPTVLYGAQRAKHTYALEANAVVYEELTSNLQLNPSFSSKVTCTLGALSAKSGLAQMYVRTSSSDSMSSMLPTLSGKLGYKVRAVTIEEWVAKQNIGNVNFIKMDIEAGEYECIPAMSSYLRKVKPTLYLSLHPKFLRDQLKWKEKQESHLTDPIENTVEALKQNLMNHLDFYPHIYDARGKQVKRSQVLKGNAFSSYIFTYEGW